MQTRNCSLMSFGSDQSSTQIGKIEQGPQPPGRGPLPSCGIFATGLHKQWAGTQAQLDLHKQRVHACNLTRASGGLAHTCTGLPLMEPSSHLPPPPPSQATKPQRLGTTEVEDMQLSLKKIFSIQYLLSKPWKAGWSQKEMPDCSVLIHFGVKVNGLCQSFKILSIHPEVIEFQ